MAQVMNRNEWQLRIQRQDMKEFRRLYVVSFVVFFIFAVVAHFLPRTWRAALGLHSVERRSILQEANATATTYLPFVFMN